jgi:cell division protein FtsB
MRARPVAACLLPPESLRQEGLRLPASHPTMCFLSQPCCEFAKPCRVFPSLQREFPPLSMSGGSYSDDLSRLKRLIASKDAQIEALSSRIEVLTDDLHEMRADHEAAGAQALRLQDESDRYQREAEAHHARAQRWEAEAAAASRRADDAERALIATEEGFAEELAALRELALAQPMNEKRDSEAAVVETPEAAGAVASEPSAAAAAGGGGGWPCLPRARESDADAPQLLGEVKALRDQVASLKEQNGSLRTQVEDLRDKLIEKTEAELGIAEGGVSGATASCAPCVSSPVCVAGTAVSEEDTPSRTVSLARSVSPPTSKASRTTPPPTNVATATHPPTTPLLPAARSPARSRSPSTRSSVHTSAGAGAGHDDDPCLGSGDAERARWRREVHMRHDLSSTDTMLPSGLRRDSGLGYSFSTLKASVVYGASERRGYGYAHERSKQQAAALSSTYSGLQRTSHQRQAHAEPHARPPPSRPPRSAPPVSASPPWDSSSRAPPAVLHAGGPGIERHAHPPLAEQQALEAEAERRVREQLRALLVAKETALSAVAQL